MAYATSGVPLSASQRAIANGQLPLSQSAATVRVSPTTHVSRNMPPVIPVLPSTSSQSSGASRNFIPPTPVSKSPSVQAVLSSRQIPSNQPSSRSSPLNSSPLAINESEMGRHVDYPSSREEDREYLKSSSRDGKPRNKRPHVSRTSDHRHRERTPSLPVNSSAPFGTEVGAYKDNVSIP